MKTLTLHITAIVLGALLTLSAAGVSAWMLEHARGHVIERAAGR